MHIPVVSVVIPVKNEAAKIRACIDGILSQTIPVKEIVVVDSGSTDGTIAILKSYPAVKLIEIEPSQFNHGLTRNLGVSHASGEFVVLTVGDAEPVDKFWLQNLLNGFEEPEVAAVCGQQVVPHHRDKNPAEWFRPVSAPSTKKFHFTRKEDFCQLAPFQKKEACSWDDVTAMYRREILLEIPFRKTAYCEDMIWAGEALLTGHALVYNTAARVYHYHLEDAEFTYKRSFTASYYRYKYLEFVPEIPHYSLRQWAGIFKTVFLQNGFSLAEKIHWWNYNVTQWKMQKKAVVDFLYHLQQGEKQLDEYHLQTCGRPPVPLKTASA
jgi:rhamnosyltransferase